MEFRSRTKALYSALWDKDLNQEERLESIYIAKNLPNNDNNAIQRLLNIHYILSSKRGRQLKFSSNALKAFVLERSLDAFNEELFIAETWRFLTNNEKITICKIAEDPKKDLDHIGKIVEN